MAQGSIPAPREALRCAATAGCVFAADPSRALAGEWVAGCDGAVGVGVAVGVDVLVLVLVAVGVDVFVLVLVLVLVLDAGEWASSSLSESTSLSSAQSVLACALSSAKAATTRVCNAYGSALAPTAASAPSARATRSATWKVDCATSPSRVAMASRARCAARLAPSATALDTTMASWRTTLWVAFPTAIAALPARWPAWSSRGRRLTQSGTGCTPSRLQSSEAKPQQFRPNSS